MMSLLRKIFHLEAPMCTPAQAKAALDDALYLCGVTQGPRWVTWYLTEVMESISNEHSDVIKAWSGLHAVYRFRTVYEKKK